MKIKIIILVLFIQMNIFLFAENNKLISNKNDTTSDFEIDIKTAINLGLKNNLNLKSELLNLEKKRMASYTGWNTFIPDMSFTNTYSRMNSREKTNDTDPNDLNLAFNFNLSLTLNAKMFYSIYSTVLDYNDGKIQIKQAQKQLTRDIKKSYYNLLLLKRKIDLAEESLNTEKNIYDQAIIDYKRGLKSEYDLLSAQVSYETLKPDLINAKDDYYLAELSFKNVLGIKDDVKIRLCEDLEINQIKFDSKELIDKYLSTGYDIQRLNLTKKMLLNQRKMGISALTPSFNFSFVSNPVLKYDLTKYNTWSNDPAKDWQDNLGNLSFSFSLPITSLVPFSQSQMDIINNEIEIQKINLSINQGKLDAEEAIIKSVSTLNKSLQSQELLKLNIDLAARAYGLANEAYRSGTKDILNLQNSKTKLEKAKISLLEELINYLTTLIELEYQVNSELK